MLQNSVQGFILGSFSVDHFAVDKWHKWLRAEASLSVLIIWHIRLIFFLPQSMSNDLREKTNQIDLLAQLNS